MKIDELRKLEPMKYWSLPKGTNYETKFKSELAKGNYIATMKRDGQLYRFSKSSENSILQSRTVSKKTGELVEKQDNVPQIMEQLNKLPVDTMIMGEICYPLNSGKVSSDVTKIMGCLAQKAIERQKKDKLHYFIFDVLMYDGYEYYNLPYEQRIAKIEEINNQFHFPEFIEFADPTFTDIEEHILNWLSLGEEGGVLMHKDKPYVFDKRPAWTAIKIKQSLEEDLDLVIMNYSEPTKEYTGKYPISHRYWENIKTGELVEGNYYTNGGYIAVSSNYFNGLIGGLVLGAYYNNQLIEVAKVANLTDEMRQKITANPNDYLNTVVKVSAMSIDQDKRSLRHPKLIEFRNDKNSKDCLYNEIFI